MFIKSFTIYKKNTTPRINPRARPAEISVMSWRLKYILDAQTASTARTRSGSRNGIFVNTAAEIITALAAWMLGKDELSIASYIILCFFFFIPGLGFL